MITKIKTEIIGHSNFFKVTFLSTISSGLKIATSFIISKIISIYIGPVGFAISGQMNNILSILHAFGSAGVNVGLVKYVSEHENDELQKAKFIQATFWLMVIFTFISSIGLIVFSPYISTIITKSADYYLFVILLGLAMFFYNTGQIFLAIFNGLKLFKSFILINILISIFSLIISVGFIFWLGLNGVILSIIVNLFLYFIVIIPFLRKAKWFNLNNILPKYNSLEVRKLLSFSLMFLFSASVIPIVQIFLRSHIITNLSLNDAGFWEALNRISQIPVLILTTAFSTYYLPSLAQLKSKELIRTEIVKTVRIISIISALVLFTIYVLREFIIILVFNESFLQLSDLLPWQLIGDFLRMLSFVFAYVLLAKAQTKYFIIAEVIYGLFFYVFSVIFINHFGLIGITYSYFLSYLIYFSVVFVFFKMFKINE